MLFISTINKVQDTDPSVNPVINCSGQLNPWAGMPQFCSEYFICDLRTTVVVEKQEVAGTGTVGAEGRINSRLVFYRQLMQR